MIRGGFDKFGIYIGNTVHEVAQVVAAGHSVDPQAADSAVVASMVRVMMLVPFVTAGICTVSSIQLIIGIAC